MRFAPSEAKIGDPFFFSLSRLPNSEFSITNSITSRLATNVRYGS
jgi:hypothetical protein